MPRAIIAIRHDVTALSNVDDIMRAARLAGVPVSFAMQGSTVGKTNHVGIPEIRDLINQGAVITAHGCYHKWPIVRRWALGSPEGDLTDSQFCCVNQQDLLRETLKLKTTLAAEGIDVKGYQSPYNYGNRTLLYALLEAGYEYANCLGHANTQMVAPKHMDAIGGVDGAEVYVSNPQGFTVGGTVSLQYIDDSNIENSYREMGVISEMTGYSIVLSQAPQGNYNNSSYCVQYATVPSAVSNSATVPIDIALTEFPSSGEVMFATPSGSNAYRQYSSKNDSQRTLTLTSAVTLPAGTSVRVYREVVGDVPTNIEMCGREPIMGIDGTAKLTGLSNVGGDDVSLMQRSLTYSTMRPWNQVEDAMVRLFVGTGYVGTITFHDVGDNPDVNESTTEHYVRLWDWCRNNGVQITDVETVHGIYTKPWLYPASSKSFNCCLNGEQRYMLSVDSAPYLSYDYTGQGCAYHPPSEQGAPCSIADGKPCGWSTVSNGKWCGYLCRFWSPESRHRIRLVCRKTPGAEPVSGGLVVRFAGFRWVSGPFYWQRPLLSYEVPYTSIGADWATIELPPTEPYTDGVWLGGLSEGLLYVQATCDTGKYFDVAEMRVERV